MNKAFFIINAAAGKNRLRGLFLDIAQKFCAKGLEPVVHITLYEKHGEELAMQAAKENAALIVCCGGDGTLNEVVSGVVKSGENIPIGYIPSGSTNDFAQSMKIPFGVNEAVDRILNGEETPIDVGEFNGRFFNYVASFGAFTAVSYNTPRESKNMFGHLAYIFEGAKDLGSITPHHARITTDSGEVLEGDYSFGAIGNSRSIGGVVHIPDDIVSMNDGRFEILLIKMPQNPNQLAMIVHGLTMSDFSSDMFCLVQAKSLLIETDGSFDWSLDGEFEKGAEKIEILNLHNAVTFKL